MRVRLDSQPPGSASNVAPCNAMSAMLREHSYLGHAQLRALGGVGEMFDTLLVYENFPTGRTAAGGELAAARCDIPAGRVGKPAHFPITLAAHMADGELVVLVEVVDGALGGTTPGRWVGGYCPPPSNCCSEWDRPLREVSVLLRRRGGPVARCGHARPRGTRARHPRPVRCGRRARYPDNPAVSWAGGTLSYRELDALANRLAARLAARGRRCRNPGGDKAFPRPAVRRRDARGAQSRRDVRAGGAGDARGTVELDSAPNRCHNRLDEGREECAGQRTVAGDFQPSRRPSRAHRLRRLHLRHDR